MNKQINKWTNKEANKWINKDYDKILYKQFTIHHQFKHRHYFFFKFQWSEKKILLPEFFSGQEKPCTLLSGRLKARVVLKVDNAVYPSDKSLTSG